VACSEDTSGPETVSHKRIFHGDGKDEDPGRRKRPASIRVELESSFHFPYGDEPRLWEHILESLLSLVGIRTLNDDDTGRTGLDGVLDLEFFQLIARHRHRCTAQCQYK
jgi:hypothetical protein